MAGQETSVVIGAGIIGCAVACALARANRPVRLIDRGEPGLLGASYGNVGHIASELIEPLPCTRLLFGFWRQLFVLDGPLDIALSRLGAFLPWARRFAAAAWRQRGNTRHLAPLVSPAATVHERWLSEIGRPDLLRRHGHFELWLDPKCGIRARDRQRAMNELGVRAEIAPATLVERVRVAARSSHAAGLWFPDTAHIVDPLELVRAYARAALDRGSQLTITNVRALTPSGDFIEVITDGGTIRAREVIVCAGARAASLLAPFGLRAPLEAAHGYHIELQGHAPLADAPIVYANENIVVTPMNGRLRCTGYMEFSGLDSQPDPRKPARLCSLMRRLGYTCESNLPGWRGERPVLPDYLPGIGRAPGPARLFYAIGHQHIGLTLAPITAELIADLVAGREPRLPIDAFDLRRFSVSRR